MDLGDHAHLVRYPWASTFYVCRTCDTHIALLDQLNSLIFNVRVDQPPRIFNWTWEQDGVFNHLDNVHLPDIPNDEVDVVEVECLGCGTLLGEKMVHEPGDYTIKMDRLLHKERGLTSSALVWLPPQNYRRN